MRRVLRQRRRSHRETRPLRARAGDAYSVLLTAVVVGEVAVQGARRVVDAGFDAVPAGDADLAAWLALALAVVLAGAALRGLVAAGPVIAGPAFVHWLLSSPVSRRPLLIPRYTATAATAATAGAALGALLAGGADLAAGDAALAAALGAAVAAGIFGGAVVAQAGRPATARLTGAGLVAAGLGLAVAAVVADRVAAPLPPPNVSSAAAAAAMSPVALLLLASGAARLGCLDRQAVSAGTGLVVAAQVAGTMLDPTILTGVLEERRWRRIGRVRSRPFAGAGPVALLRADLRRAARAPGALPGALGLLVVPYAAAGVLPAPLVPAVTTVAAYLVANRYAAGLRAVSRAPALRRTLGGSDRVLTLLHLVVPLAAATAWTALVLPALLPARAVAIALIPLGAVAVTQRVASRDTPAYGGVLFEPGFGAAVPVDLIRGLLRGVALLAVLAGVQVLLA